MISIVKYTGTKYAAVTSIFNLEMKTYARWSQRKPKIISNDAYEETPNELVTNVVEVIAKHHEPAPTKQRKSKPNKIELVTKATIDSNGDVFYTKAGINDPKISTIISAVKSKKTKQKENLILLEGKRLIRDALESKCVLKYLLFSRKQDLECLKTALPKRGATIYKVLYREMHMWSDLTTPSIMGIFEKPDVKNVLPKDALPITVICDNIREPGNLGSILRTCAGVGCEKVLLTKGCTDAWDTKVLRSASGAHFHLQIHTKLHWRHIEESLSAASKVYVADNTAHMSTTNSHDSKAHHSIPAVPYNAIDCGGSEPVVLIIGGETEGVSEEAYEFVTKLGGVRLNIPMRNRIDSLNSGVALGVIAFEIKNRLLRKPDCK